MSVAHGGGVRQTRVAEVRAGHAWRGCEEGASGGSVAGARGGIVRHARVADVCSE